MLLQARAQEGRVPKQLVSNRALLQKLSDGGSRTIICTFCGPDRPPKKDPPRLAPALRAVQQPLLFTFAVRQLFPRTVRRVEKAGGPGSVVQLALEGVKPVVVVVVVAAVIVDAAAVLLLLLVVVLLLRVIVVQPDSQLMCTVFNL